MFDDPRKGTAVAALGSGGLMVILAYILFLFHIDVPAPVLAAATGLIGSAAGIFVHSTFIQEDRAALHRLILAHLGGQIPPETTVLSPMPTAPGRLAQRSAAEMLRQVEANDRQR